MAAKKKQFDDTAAKRGYSIRIYLPDGTADGLEIVEKSNWSGRGVVCPRALFAESKWGAKPEQVRGVLSYLATGEERRVELSEAALNEAREKIRTSMSEMRSLLDDVDENVALLEDFPQTEDKSRCLRCNFRQFCEGSAGIPGAELAGDPP